MHRGWQDDPLFAGDAFSRRDAWEWLIAEAAWEPHRRWFKGHMVELERGDLAVSERDLATRWKWGRQMVRTFLLQLSRSGMLTRKSTRAETHGLTQLNVCKYDKYQAEQPTEEPAGQPKANPSLTQGQPTIEEGKEREEGEETKNEEGARFAFFGRTIKLNARDLEQWKLVYHAIPDIMAELTALDAWLQAQSDGKRKGWFHTVSGALNRKHQEILAVRLAPAEERYSGEAPIC